jgi:tetratricopeptide (TPR) repeat protein
MNSASKYGVTLLLLCCLALPAFGQQTSARAWEGTIDLPTYLLGEEDPYPPFSKVNSHGVYPYTMLDDLTDRREPKTYRAIFLENEYLKATILPDVGGRLYSLYDKAAQREVFYRNNVVKYGLVALRGAWISGGVEFNFPNGHTVVTVSPVDSSLINNADGSASAIVGGVDQITGMHWEVALTLRPGQGRLEQRVTLFNSTPLTNLYWYWANAAVPATSDMQFIYPMREVNPHSRSEIWTYPLWKGTDYSWYKNIRQPTSLFGLQIHRNFFGAYYHDSDYGVAHVADFREVPGKKIWSWGVADDGLIWTDLLTDHDGSYNEIQSGRFETQLNREFMPPRRVESWTEFWYPVRGLEGGFVEATSDLALNVTFATASGAGKPRVKFSVYPTTNVQHAVLRVTSNGQLLREFSPVDFTVSTTASFSLPIPDVETTKRSLNVEINSSEGRSLLRWSAADPVDGNHDFVSTVGERKLQPKAPEKLTPEELYLRGVQQEKDGQEEAAATTYQHVLERDPDNIPALLKLAWRSYLAVDFASAENLIGRAIARNASDPDIQYAAGTIYRASGQWSRASDAFWTSIQFGGQPAQAFAQLGEISLEQKNYSEATRLLRRALNYNPEDALAWAEMAVAAWLQGNSSEAHQAADQALKLMPILPHAVAEKNLADSQGFSNVVNSSSQNALEVAAWYRSLNDLASADAVLEAAVKDKTSQVAPLIYYYLASNAWKEGRNDRAQSFAAKAAAAAPDKVFPQGLSDAAVLTDAISRNPSDGHAHAFLGNFLFAHGRYDDAVKQWTQALETGFDNSELERNLGVYAWRVKRDLKSAAAYYQKAIRMTPSQYRLYPDLDEIYAQSQDLATRTRLFAEAPASVLEHDTVRVRHVLLLVEQRQYVQALALLANHRFKPWEGGEIVREMFVLATLEKGRQALDAKQYSVAEQVFRRALEYPVNLGVGKPDKPDDAEAFYWLGEALQAEHKLDAARAAWQSAASVQADAGASAVFRAMALRHLGRTDEASAMLEKLSQIKDDAGPYQFYAAGLAERARARESAAQADFRRALELDPTFWKARLAMGSASASGRP